MVHLGAGMACCPQKAYHCIDPKIEEATLVSHSGANHVALVAVAGKVRFVGGAIDACRETYCGGCLTGVESMTVLLGSGIPENPVKIVDEEGGIHAS